MPLDEAIEARRISSGDSYPKTIAGQNRHCVTLLDAREYEHKEQAWLDEERMD